MPHLLVDLLLDLAPWVTLTSVMVMASPPSSIFALHPFLVAFAVLGLMPSGIRLMDRYAWWWSWFSAPNRKIRTKWHWIVQVVGTILLLLAVVAIYVNKVLNGKPHFTTWHGLCGLLCLIYAIVQLTAGFALHWSIWPVRHLLSYQQAKLCHIYSALGLTALITATLLLGLQSNWLKGTLPKYISKGNETVTIVVLSVCTGCTLLRIAMQIGRPNKPSIASKSAK